MSYPGSTFTWHDQSAIAQTATIESVDNSPLYFAVSSFDRGPEDLRIVSNQNFYNLYGSKMNFARHGQPAIQIANVINGGGRVLLKRLVAEDALLANTIAVATVKEIVSAVKATDGDTNGKTLGELMNGVPDAPIDYVEDLSMVSSVDDTTGTLISVNTVLSDPSNTYMYRTGNSVTDIQPVEGTTTDNTFTAWDGVTELDIADGTKVQVVEVTTAGVIVKSGIINVVSKIPHPAKTSTAPDNTDLATLYVTSKEGTNEGYTELTVSPTIGSGNVYRYNVVTAQDTTGFPTTVDTFDDSTITAWTAWNGTDQLELEEGTQIRLCEFSVVDVTDAEQDNAVVDHTYAAVKGALVTVVAKLPADERTSNQGVTLKPSNDKYIASGQQNVVAWEAMSVTNCKTMEEVMEAATEVFAMNDPTAVTNEDGTVVVTRSSSYPLFVVADNGRGVSNKSLRFVPDYVTSKEMTNMYYTVYTYDGTTLLENVACSLNPSAVFNNTRYGLNEDTSIQLKFDTISGVYEAYVAHLANLTGISVDQLMKSDVMFLTTGRGASMSGVSIEEDSADFGADYGVSLANGSNGEFGNAPFGTEAYTAAAVDVINGTYDDIVWDVDTYKVCAVFDANYPEAVKDAFAAFANFRQDCVFFRDYGVDVFSYASIVTKCNAIASDYKTRFNAEYYTTYQIYDPETKVRERVTMMYDFARAAVDHFAAGAYRPLAGVANNMILANAIEGTINFTPRIIPLVNQKQLLDDLRVNYAIFEEGRCVVQSLYTSQPEYTQLSYVNNVLAIQEVVRAVRTSCPRQRYTFTSGSDFTSYADAVNNTLRGFTSNFASLEFGYEQNNLQAMQKIFYATIYFRFNNWAQTEHFDLFALGNE